MCAEGRRHLTKNEFSVRIIVCCVAGTFPPGVSVTGMCVRALFSSSC